jgi:putative transposase
VAEQRATVAFLVRGGLSVQRACQLVGLHRSTFHYTAHARDDTALVDQIQALATQHPRYGYRRIWALLNRTQRVNHKRVRRLWRLKRLQVRRVVRPRLHRPRPAQLAAVHPGHIWAYDFLEDALADGTKIHILTVMDEFTREGLAIEVTCSTSAAWVVDVLRVLIAQHGAPGYLRSDNGPEFVAQAVQTWLASHHVETLYIEPGKPWQNGKEERLNGTVRDECLNVYLFQSLAEACVRLGAFRRHYNTERPHSQLGYLTPAEFKAAWVAAQAKLQDP